jgi:hypothetical protein
MNPFSQIIMAAVFAAGIAAGSAGYSLYDRLIDDPAVRRAGVAHGVQAERLAWQEARNRAEVEKAQRLAEAQAKITAADRALQDQRANERRRADAIRRAYEERKTDDKADPVPGCDCSQYALPDWVRKELE